MSDSPTKRITPPVASDVVVARLRAIHHATWPAGLGRYIPFSLIGEDPTTAYIPVAWQPDRRLLYTQTVTLGEGPPASRMPTSVAVDCEDWMERVRPVAMPLRPRCMETPLAKVPLSMLDGYEQRTMLINALLMVDPVGDGHDTDYIVNDYVFFDTKLRNERIRQISQELETGPGFRPYILKLLTRFLWYGGGAQALLALTPLRGGPEEERRTPACKPGRLSNQEMLNRARAEVRGSDTFRRGMRIEHRDIACMTEALKIDWVINKLSVAETHRRMIERDYKGTPTWKRPAYARMLYHYKGIVQKHGFLEQRLGRDATNQYVTPRTGSSSDLTQGVLEILDMDGFKPKLHVGALVDKRLQPIEIWIIFAVSRLSGAIWGYEICINGERTDGYLRCLVSALLPMDDYVASRGVAPLPGLVHGNIDAVFTDNGPGKSKRVREAINEKLGGIMFNPPGGRGDLKAMIERLNRTMIYLMAQETAQGYTRDRSLIEQIKRRIRRRVRPMPLDDFERLLLKAINHINLTANKRRLRTAEMRKARVGITPVEIHEYHQKHGRTGEAARIRTAAEIYDIFLPWKPPVTCTDGKVRYKDAYYTSNALKELANNYAKLPGTNPSLKVEIKPAERYSNTLLCRDQDRNVFEIEMTEADLRRFGKVTWSEHVLALLDEAIQEDPLVVKRAKAAGKLKSTKQEEIDAIEYGRGNVYAGAVGPTLTKAKQNGVALREHEHAERERAAYGLPPSVVRPDPPQSPPTDAAANVEAVDDPLAAAARAAEERFRGRV